MKNKYFLKLRDVWRSKWIYAHKRDVFSSRLTVPVVANSTFRETFCRFKSTTISCTVKLLNKINCRFVNTYQFEKILDSRKVQYLQFQTGASSILWPLTRDPCFSTLVEVLRSFWKLKRFLEINVYN